MSIKWTAQEERLLKSKDFDVEDTWVAIENAYVAADVGFETYRSRDAVARKLKRVVATLNEPDNTETVIDVRIAKMKKIYEKYADEQEAVYLPTTSKDRFILCLSDIHLPFAPVDRIVEVLKSHAKDFKAAKESCIVLNGDTMDLYSASVFSKGKTVAVVREYQSAMELVDLCLDYAQNVFLVRGNHEKRLMRLTKESFATPVSSVFGSDLLARLANGEEIGKDGLSTGFRKKFKGRVHYQQLEPWYIRVGKTIFAHASAFKSGPGGTVNHVLKYLDGRYTRDEFDAVVHGHTHCLYKGVVGNRLLIEQGALCGLQDYEHDDRLKYGASQSGYAYVWQDEDGNTNFNDSNFVYLGSMLPPKKKVMF
jgi:predicted phosphodiesterase